jgi:C_GCAxxG_C_C family probable redox protein
MQNALKKYWDKTKYNYSCSETMLCAANEVYNLGLDETHLKMMSPFSGGMFIGETCGVVTGGITVLGLLFVNNNKADSPKMIEAVKEFQERFKTELKTNDCTPLKELYEEETVGCGNLILAGGKILQEVIEKYQK